MRELFPGYYRPTNLDLWENCLFVFDTNVLLNLYRYKTTTQETLFEILGNYSDRIFIPFQVAYEYQKNRISVITEQEEAYNKIEELLDTNLTNLKRELNTYKRHPLINIEDLAKQIDKFHKRSGKDLKIKKESHPNLIFNDPIREKLDDLFINKIGTQYELKDGDLKEFQARYDKKIPPGYKDNNKKENKFGDLIFWTEIMEKALLDSKNIILVTDDVKEDWWWRPKGQTFGPRPELIEEFTKVTGCSIYFHQTENFIKNAQQHLGTNTQTATAAIQDVQSVKELDEGLTIDDVIDSSTYNDYLRDNANRMGIKKTNAFNTFQNNQSKWRDYIKTNRHSQENLQKWNDALNSNRGQLESLQKYYFDMIMTNKELSTNFQKHLDFHNKFNENQEVLDESLNTEKNDNDEDDL